MLRVRRGSLFEGTTRHHTETQNMMKKNAIALAVAAICASPLSALAAGAAQVGTGHWEVTTPSSPNEAAPQLAFSRSHLGSAPAVATAQTETPTPVAEVVTPLSVDESAPWLTVEDKRKQRAAVRTKVVSLANPQTPWSPNESGTDRYAQDMREYREHVASVEQARIQTAAADAANAAAAVAAAQPTPVEPATTAELDRLLTNPSNTPPERDREALATANPALVDSRQTAATELRPETAPSDRPAPEAAPSGMPAESARTAEAANAPAQVGANTVAAASSSVSGSTAEVSIAPAPSPETPIVAAETPALSTTAAAPEVPPPTQGSATNR
jgi:hypothetical protein